MTTPSSASPAANSHTTGTRLRSSGGRKWRKDSSRAGWAAADRSTVTVRSGATWSDDTPFTAAAANPDAP